jgi:hypothetical protein
MARKRRRNAVIGIVAAVLVVVALALGFYAVDQNSKLQGARSLQASIVESAKECCAIEGSYPSSLEHLEEDYGLSVNHDDYVVTYEWFADNVMPSVVVVPR